MARRTVSSEIASTTFNSTNLSASSCMADAVLSSGGSEHAKAISLASAVPLSVRSRLGLSWRLRRRWSSNPRSTNRSWTRLMVRNPTSKSLAMVACPPDWSGGP